MKCAEEAEQLVNGPRQGAYGPPEESMEQIAQVWTGLLRMKLHPDAVITGAEVALLLTGMKLAREMGGTGKRDNVVDADGYLLIVERIKGY